eukprot:c19558_g1_i1 orf=3-227(-)
MGYFKKMLFLFVRTFPAQNLVHRQSLEFTLYCQVRFRYQDFLLACFTSFQLLIHMQTLSMKDTPTYILAKDTVLL